MDIVIIIIIIIIIISHFPSVNDVSRVLICHVSVNTLRNIFCEIYVNPSFVNQELGNKMCSLPETFLVKIPFGAL